ncbi:aspartyl protease family protein [Arenibacter latericius]|uniref:aspartyl protease family protein n=1 Tax=Arenibacter latericius TaxID=86104 RepID=UPI0003F90576|nr:aspartyl protease family protein [Arenibacter latericius]
MISFFKRSWLLLFCLPVFLYAQQYTLSHGKKYEKVKFKLVNNLILIPVDVNGAKLTFILDSGVSTPILFNISDQDSIQINDVSEVIIRGLGNGEPIEALKSSNNTFKIGNTRNNQQLLYVVMDRALNFSPRLGMVVHGIIGYDLFRDFVVSINYTSKVIKLYDPKHYKPKNNKKTQTLPLHIESNKAYLEANVVMDDRQNIPVKLLIDSGSSDALWLFQDEEKGLAIPLSHYEDFLGQGLSGSVYGKRTKIKGLLLGDFQLNEAKTAFPDMEYFSGIFNLGDRNGSLGGEVLKRFTMVFNYGAKTISLRKNSLFDDPFNYNLSGIDLQHNGMRFISERITDAKGVALEKGDSFGNVQILFEDKTRLSVVPEIIVSGIRVGSPGQEAGLREGDIILAVNGKKIHNYELQQILKMLNEKEGKKVKVHVGRLGTDVIVSYVLKKMFK